LALFIFLLCGLGEAWLAAAGYVAYMLTHPPRHTYAWAVARGRPGDPSELPGDPRRFEAWTFRSRGLELPAWEIAGDLARGGAGGEGPTVILTHGWGSSRVSAMRRLPAYLRSSSRVIMWDLPGHGDAPGVCRLGTAEVEDLLALVEAVMGEGKEGPLVLAGSSLGAGVSIAAAARSGAGLVAGVIAEAPYRVPITPARNVLRQHRLPYRLNLGPALWGLGVWFGVVPRWRGFDRAALAAGLRCPLLVLHGDQDDVSPVEDGRAIAGAAGEGRMVEVAGAGHNDLWAAGPFGERSAAIIGEFLAATCVHARRGQSADAGRP
jgi:pimeloyl-ACP methyl ester carboxylesterase